MDFVSQARHYGIYIDADNNRSTGFIGCGGGYKIGAEYMIEGTLLHRYTMGGTSWNRELVSLLNYAAVYNKVEMTLFKRELYSAAAANRQP